MTKLHLVGMLHLPPLPGSPRSELSLSEIAQAASAEAALLERAGFDAAMIENFGDVPFAKDSVAPITVAAMTRIVTEVRNRTSELRLGVNVLRNDARAALAVAVATGSGFMRVNVHVGATATDQGIVEGRACDILRERRSLGAEVAIWADVHVKHGRSLAHASIGDEAADAVERGLADALIVSGSGTGHATSPRDLEAVKERGLGVPIYVGSGVDADSVGELVGRADGIIVGTSLKKDGITTNPMDVDRVGRFVDAARRRGC